MKTLSFLALIAIGFAMTISSCNKTAGARYIDLSTGKEVKLEKDEATGLWVDVDTKKPVYMYVDTRTNDTIYGSTGKVINGQVARLEDGSYRFIGEYDYKSADGNLKVEVEKDGDITIKDGDKKIKIDAEEGEKKVKND